MTKPTLFLSHIHEEEELANLIKEAIEEEFSGFIDVFVSSDGVSIPAGSNILKKIEKGLIGCTAALYLISPISVKKNWINFELGAVWIRSVLNLNNDENEIPTIPICHSGIVPSQLPQPINNLNAIQANLASQLESAFKSLQQAFGGRGKLKTDFDLLKDKIVTIEKKYTVGRNLKDFFNITNTNMQEIINQCQDETIEKITISCGILENSKFQSMKKYESGELLDVVTVKGKDAVLTVDDDKGITNEIEVSVIISKNIILDNKDVLLS